MSENNKDFDLFDPTGLLKTMRNDHLEVWSKTMVQFVNSDAYAFATGKMLDIWLSNSAPFRKMIENALAQTLANLNIPSREEVARLAQQLTNIELRLDDLDIKLDESLMAARSARAGTDVPQQAETP
jgi:hypothetical protein